MNRKHLERHTTQFDIDDVTWEIKESKRADKVEIILKCDTRFNLMKVWLSLKAMCEKMDLEFGYMENADEENKQ